MLEKILRFVTAVMVVIAVYLSTGYQPVHAQTATAMDVIQAVNALRASYDLPPYEVSNEWMSVAQEQSDYQASIGELTHLRADGTGPGDHGISSENIGGGYSLSAEGLISQWSDYWHAFTMIGFSSGLVGCGVALSDNGYYYYTLVVKNTGKLTGLKTRLSHRSRVEPPRWWQELRCPFIRPPCSRMVRSSTPFHRVKHCGVLLNCML